MKKKYIQPTTKLHSVSISRMMATSNLGYDEGQGTTGNGITSGSNDSKDDLDFGW